MSYLLSGNAFTDRNPRQWIIGHFMGENTPYKSEDVEVKWATHPKGDSKPLRDEANGQDTITILIEGHFVFQFPDKEVEISKPGDYVFFKGVSHGYVALSDSTAVTVRWPSAKK